MKNNCDVSKDVYWNTELKYRFSFQEDWNQKGQEKNTKIVLKSPGQAGFPMPIKSDFYDVCAKNKVAAP